MKSDQRGIWGSEDSGIEAVGEMMENFGWGCRRSGVFPGDVRKGGCR